MRETIGGNRSDRARTTHPGTANRAVVNLVIALDVAHAPTVIDAEARQQGNLKGTVRHSDESGQTEAPLTRRSNQHSATQEAQDL